MQDPLKLGGGTKITDWTAHGPQISPVTSKAVETLKCWYSVNKSPQNQPVLAKRSLCSKQHPPLVLFLNTDAHNDASVQL